MNFDCFIDKITNSIEDATSGKSLETTVTLLTPGELKMILKKHGWKFNWKKEGKYQQRQIFKLTIADDFIIQGLICIERMDNFIELHLIEVASHNYGSQKRYRGVAGNLVAYACKASFEAGFEGFVAFKAKTNLIQHYTDTLGASIIFKDRMSITTLSARKLVNSYYRNFFHEQ